MNITEESIRFCREALVDIYGARKELDKINFQLHAYKYGSPNALRELENKICDIYSNPKDKERKVSNLFIADKILRTRNYQTVRWTATVTFNANDPFDISYKINFTPPVIEQAVSLYSYALESDRFLHVKLKGLASMFNTSNVVFSQFANQYWPQAELFKQGILFGGRKYYFLGGEIEKNQESEFTDEEDSSTSSVILAWFYACQDPYYTIHTIRNYFGHLSLLPPGKCNARVKLGFSLIYPFHIADDQVLVRPDIASDITGKILTDGCGFIAYDLAHQLPYAISHGGYAQLREVDWPAPAIIQVRAVCRAGLFKGCLLVTTDISLCPVGKIVFRESMRKAHRYAWQTNTLQYDTALLGVVETFEHPLQLSRYGKHRKLSDFQTKLNRPLCLLLNYLKVSSQFFMEMVMNELEPWVQRYDDHEDNKNSPSRDSSTCNFNNNNKNVSSKVLLNNNNFNSIKFEERWHLYSLAKQFIQTEFIQRQQQHHQQPIVAEPIMGTGAVDGLENNVVGEFGEEWLMTDEECDFSTIGDNDAFQEELAQDKLTFASNKGMRNASSSSLMFQPIESSLGEKILQFLLAGVSLQDTYFQQLWQKLLKAQFAYMKKCHFTVSNGLYLVGAPDPYGILAPNEVYICFPGDRKKMRETNLNMNLKYENNRVIVSRNPMHHPGDIRVFEAVRPKQLVEAFEISTNGGVIFFSTQGIRAPADEMSGGDYDGDKFIILFDTNSQLVKKVQCIPPFEDADDATEESAKLKTVTSLSSFDCCICPHQEIHDGCPLCRDSLGFEMLQGLLSTAQTQHIGKYSNAWLAYSDTNPLSAEALACGKIVRIALDAAKSGIKIPGRPDLLRYDCYPEYLKKPSQKKKFDYSKSSSAVTTNNYNTVYQTPPQKQTTSVLQSTPSKSPLPLPSPASSFYSPSSVYNHAPSTPSSIYSPSSVFSFSSPSSTLPEPSYSPFSMASPSTTTTATTGCFEGPISVLTQLYKLIEEKESKYLEYLNNTNEQFGLLFDWDMLMVEGDELGNERIFSRKEASCVPSTLADTLQDIDLISYQPIKEIQDSLYFILQEYQQELNEWNLWIKGYKEEFSVLFRQKETKNVVKLKVLFQHQMKRFLEKCNTFHQKYYCSGTSQFDSEQIARQRLASLIYVSTYCTAKARNNNSSQEASSSSSLVWPISYCWEICGHELRKNKTFARCRRKGLEPMNMDPSEMVYLR